MTQIRVSRRVPFTPRVEHAIASLPLAFVPVDGTGDVVLIDGSDAVEAASNSEGPETEIWIDPSEESKYGNSTVIDTFRSDVSLAAARALLASRREVTHGNVTIVGDDPHEVLVDLERAVLGALDLSAPMIPVSASAGCGGADLAGRSLAHFSVLRVRHRSPTTVAVRLAGVEFSVEIATRELEAQPWVVSVADDDGVRTLPLIYETGLRTGLRRLAETWM